MYIAGICLYMAPFAPIKHTPCMMVQGYDVVHCDAAWCMVNCIACTCTQQMFKIRCPSKDILCIACVLHVAISWDTFVICSRMQSS